MKSKEAIKISQRDYLMKALYVLGYFMSFVVKRLEYKNVNKNISNLPPFELQRMTPFVLIFQKGKVENCNIAIDCVNTKQSNVAGGGNSGLRLENEMLLKQLEEKNREINYLKEQQEFLKDLIKDRSC